MNSWTRVFVWLWAALLAVGPASASEPAKRDPLEAALALPVASELVGARDAPRFAWVESAAGIRSLWFAERGQTARTLIVAAEDDGQPLYDLALSPDGARLAFVRGGDPEARDEPLPNAASDSEPPRQQISIADTAAGDGPRVVGEGHSPVFSPDGRSLAFARRGEIWLWRSGGEARRLASAGGEIRRLTWSPDGSRLLFVSHRGDYSFVALLDPASPRVRFLDPGLGFAVEPVFSPDGREIAFIRHLDAPAGAARDSGPYWSIRIVNIASGAARELWAAPPGAGARYYESRGQDLFWSADGQLVFPWERSGWLHPHALDSKGGTPRDLTPGAFEVEMFMLGADGRSLVYAGNQGDLDRRHVWRRPLVGGAPRKVTHGSGIETAPVLGGTALAVIATDVARPAFPALAEGGLKPFRPPASTTGFVAPEAVTFRAEDGVEVHGQLFRARGSGKRPAIVYVHGGPRRQMLLGFHPSAYYSSAYVFNQHLAARGYHVLAVNYRSGTGYGNAFRDAPEIARGGASEYRDVLAAGRWLAARGEVDPTRIGLWGGSWGGYLVALGLARDSALFAAGVDFHGVHSMLRPLPGSLSPDAQAEARRLQWESSPLGAIDSWRSPVLLIHGDDDRNVDFSQSVLLARELAARRIPYRERVLPNERHSFLLHSNWLESFRAAEAFFDETLKARRR